MKPHARTAPRSVESSRNLPLLMPGYQDERLASMARLGNVEYSPGAASSTPTTPSGTGAPEEAKDLPRPITAIRLCKGELPAHSQSQRYIRNPVSVKGED